MFNNGSTKSRGSPISVKAANSPESYLSGCDKIFLDAYDRELRRLEIIRDQEAAVDQIMLQKAKDEEVVVKEKLQAKKADLARTASMGFIQTLDKVQTTKKLKEKEQHEYNSIVTAMPAEAVTIFPRITETPQEVRRSIERAKQKDLKAALESQMANHSAKKQLERNSELAEEQKRLKEVEAKMVKDMELKMQKRQEEKLVYKEDFAKTMQRKEVLKVNEKRLDTIEFEGIKTIQSTSTSKKPAFEMVTKEEDEENAVAAEQNPNEDNNNNLPADIIEDGNENNVEDNGKMEMIQKYFETSPKKMDGGKSPLIKNRKQEKQQSPSDKLTASNPDPRLAVLLEKKQRKTNELIDKITELERKVSTSKDHNRANSLKEFKSAFVREGFLFRNGGKNSRIAPEDVFRTSTSGRSPVPTNNKARATATPLAKLMNDLKKPTPQQAKVVDISPAASRVKGSIPEQNDEIQALGATGKDFGDDQYFSALEAKVWFVWLKTQIGR